jgi:transposase-like protein
MEHRSGKLVSFPAVAAEPSRDALTEVLRQGARKMLGEAIEAEVAGYLKSREHLLDEVGHRAVVRNGRLPERQLQTPLGEIPVHQPRVRDRRPAAERETFQSSILPRYLRKTRSLEELLPWLYLKGVSTGDFSEALAALLGPEAPGLSATTMARLKSCWEEEYKAWQGRSLAGADSDEAGHPFRSKPATLSERSDEQGSWLIEVAALATGGGCVVCHAFSSLHARM